MLMNEVLTHLLQLAPLPVMARMLLERALNPAHIDELFERMAVRQYTHTVLFSDIVALLSTVTLRIHRSINVAYYKYRGDLKVSFVALYGKLKRIEPGVIAAMVNENAIRMGEVITHLQAKFPPLVRGYHTRIVDGNALAATEHRLKPLRKTRSGALPGKSLVVMDHERDIIVDMLPCEDGHAQERSLFRQLIGLVHKRELWIADRNFCTKWLLKNIIARGAAFLIRQHAKLRCTEVTKFVLKGTGKDGEQVFEQRVRIGFEVGAIIVRRIMIVLKNTTRDGDRKIFILTSLPAKVATAFAVAEIYRKRWRLETMFQNLTTTLRCEVEGLGNPRAALFAFAVAILSANVLAVIRAALRAAHGQDVEERLSTYAMVDDLQGSYRGMEYAAPSVEWEIFATMSMLEFIKILLRCAKNVDLGRYPKAPTRKRERKPKAGTPTDPPHVSTYRILRDQQERRSATMPMKRAA
jgi:IS4 transposase